MDVYRAYGRLLGKEQGPPDKTPLTEESPLREKLYPYREEQLRSDNDEFRIRDEYDKIPIERIIMNNDGLPGTVLRLPMVYGPGDYQHRLFPYLKRMDDRRPGIILDESIAHWRSSRGFVEDIAHGITLAVTDERSADNIYNICERTALEEIEFVKVIAKAAGWNGEIIVRKSAELPEALRDEHATEHDLVVSSEKIRKELGYKETTPTEEAMRRTIEWERANPPPFKPEDFDYGLEDEVLAVKK
jgi:nucleoside-diphosphate-sugar epimerase